MGPGKSSFDKEGWARGRVMGMGMHGGVPEPNWMNRVDPISWVHQKNPRCCQGGAWKIVPYMSAEGWDWRGKPQREIGLEDRKIDCSIENSLSNKKALNGKECGVGFLWAAWPVIWDWGWVAELGTFPSLLPITGLWVPTFLTGLLTKKLFPTLAKWWAADT